MKHAMVDCETLGLLPGCAVISIGAVAFNPSVDGDIGSRFYRNITVESNEECSLVVDTKTVEWWETQSIESRHALLVNQVSLDRALTEFCSWWKSGGIETFWSHGLSFDEPILRVALSEVGLDPPWNYRNVRDTRTLYWLAGFDEKSVVLPNAVEHNALDDAVRQAGAVQKAMRFFVNGKCGV